MTPTPPGSNATLMNQLLSQLLTESRLSNTVICAPYDPKDSINNWLHQFELHCQRLSLTDEQKLFHIGHYLPADVANWVSRSPQASTWSSLTAALLQTFGIPPAKHKQIVRRRLESLRQGSLSSRRFAISFESILFDFPEGHTLDDATLRIIYLQDMSPKVRQLILPNIANKLTWRSISNAAIAIEESVSLDTRLLLEDEFAKLSLGSTPPVQPVQPVLPPLPPDEDVEMMDIHAFHHQRSTPSSGARFPAPRSSGASRNQPRQQRDPMRLWSESGKRICGHCKMVGHLTKKCRRQRNHAVNQVETDIQHNSEASICYIQQQPTASTSQYAAIPINDDPLVHQISNIELRPSPAHHYPTTNTDTGIPRISVTIQGHAVQALVDTGASISAIRTSMIDLLGLTVDTSHVTRFTNADNHSTTSRGVVKVNVMIGHVHAIITCHVVDGLSNQLILGYPDLKALGTVIDTTSNEVRILKTSGLSGSTLSSGSAPAICTMASSLRLPGQHHAYVDITGPPNSATFVSTSTNMVLDKLVSVATGVVNFNAEGLATIKIANLDKETKLLNKGQRIANYQYLSPSLRLYYSDNKDSINQAQTTGPVTKDTSTKPNIPWNIGQHLSASERAALIDLLEEFPDCFNSKPTSITPLVQHSIDTGDSRPLSQPPHRASAAENETIDSLLDEMLQQGIIQPSNSPWASPVVLVKKHDGSPRFCVDYRRLNGVTRKDVYPLPRIDDTIHSLGNAKIFSTLDLTSSYWQIELDEQAKPKSAFICRSGLYEFIRMPFGLTNAPATMQRLMDSVLAGLKWQTTLVYLDDIVCFSPSFDQHLQDLRSVLLRLRSASLTANLKKCHFASDRISFLGYIISPDGLHTDPEKIRAVTDFPQPTDIAPLRSFLGLAGYYRCFISKFSSLASPLNDLLKKDAVWSWSSIHQHAFDTLKQALISAPVLRFPDFSRPFELHTDGACTAGIGVILCQRDPRNNRAYAVAYASRSLSPAERNYGVSEVEALAIVWGIKKFAPYLTTTKFTVITDHHSLQFLNNGKSTDLRGRLARWTLLLQQHDFDIVYRPGSKNAGPDALSRYPSSALISALQTSDLSSAQTTDSFCQDLLQRPALPPGFSLESGILFFGPRPVLPSSMRQDIFNLLHSNPTAGHLGIGRTLQRFNRLYYSPNQQEWVKKMVKECPICQRVKRTNKTLGHTNLVHSTPSVHPFDTIAIDTFGPLPPSLSGNRYIIVIQCLFSRYVIPNW
ncbi:hypothetical protein G6F61_010372 [Rhizopus arrhizus]|nr:hypothetical protein G6F42_014280 [Rhizopus arrhizus]KAG1373209.1 hypothetical protein G6F61_010372 [Rhizopus arrhizus]